VLRKQCAAVILMAKAKIYEWKKNYPRAARQRTKLQRLAPGRRNADVDEQSRSGRRGGS
jgi:hypothetical protein